jgi:hypothetical protein
MTKHGGHEELVAGEKLVVVAIRLVSGACPVIDWTDSLTKRQRTAIQARVIMLARRGWLSSPDSFRKLADPDPAKGLPSVWEVKHAGENLRLYVVDYSPGDAVAYATHGSTKPKKKGVAREVTRARAIYQEK